MQIYQHKDVINLKT